MAVSIKEVLTQHDIKSFVNVQFDIYKNNKFWVPSIKADEEKALQAEHNPAFSFCESKFWIVLKDNKYVGRIGAIINTTYNEKMNEKVGRFSRSEFIDDNEVVDLLFSTAEAWLRDKGMTKIQGPLGFTNLDHQGMLIEGFDHLPSAVSEYHLPYYQEHLVRLGFEKNVDWLEFRLTMPPVVPEKVQRISKIIQTRNKFNVIAFDDINEVLPYSDGIFNVLNEAFSELFSVVKLDEKMIDYYRNRYLTMLNPKFIKVVTSQENKVIAFIIGLPSMSEALQKANGSLLPFGWWHLKKAMKSPKVIDLMLTGILPELQSTGVLAILMKELHQEMINHDALQVETTGMFETNTKAIQNWKNYDHIQHKRKRCWKKSL